MKKYLLSGLFIFMFAFIYHHLAISITLPEGLPKESNQYQQTSSPFQPTVITPRMTLDPYTTITEPPYTLCDALVHLEGNLYMHNHWHNDVYKNVLYHRVDTLVLEYLIRPTQRLME